MGAVPIPKMAINSPNRQIKWLEKLVRVMRAASQIFENEPDAIYLSNPSLDTAGLSADLVQRYDHFGFAKESPTPLNDLSRAL
jgi:hypothetical protein